MVTFEERLGEVLAFLVTCGVAALILGVLLRVLQRNRDGLRLGAPIAVAFALRVLAAVAVSLTAFGTTIRGPDEEGFLYFGNQLASTSIASPDWTETLTHDLHVFTVAVQDALLNPPELALRATEAAIAVAAIVLFACAVYDLAGRRASTIAAWLLALEPTSIFFSTVIHKESLMLLASGLLAFGAARLWTTGQTRFLVPMAVGCAVAAMTRGYASWFLLLAAAAITMHAAYRSYRSGANRSLVSFGVAAILIVVSVPIATREFNTNNLNRLQGSQAANTSDQSNLGLEEVDYSTGAAIVTSLPSRAADVLLQPYPWQLGNISQQFGLLGTTVAYLTLIALAVTMIQNRGSIMERAGPLVYLGLALLVAYSLSAGNAGTAFRYRVHLLAFGFCMVAVLRFGPAIATRRLQQSVPEPTPAGISQPSLG